MKGAHNFFRHSRAAPFPRHSWSEIFVAGCLVRQKYRTTFGAERGFWTPPVLRAAESLIKSGESRRSAAEKLGGSQNGLACALEHKGEHTADERGRPTTLGKKDRKQIESFVFENDKWRKGVRENVGNLRDWDKVVHKLFRKIPASTYQGLAAGFQDRLRTLIKRKGQRLRK